MSRDELGASIGKNARVCIALTEQGFVELIKSQL